MNIVVIGNGRAGSRWARLAREMGHHVWCSDIDPARCDPGTAPDQVDAVIVATPAELHFAAAFQANALWPTARMMVEKPLDVSLDHEAEWRRIRPAYVAQWRAHEIFDTLVEIGIESPEIAFLYGHPEGRGDPLMESMIHDIDLVLLLMPKARITAAFASPNGFRMELRDGRRRARLAAHHRAPERVRYMGCVDHILVDAVADRDAAYRIYLAAFLDGADAVATVDEAIAALRLALQAREMAHAKLH